MDHRAFTLVELMVVVAVIGLLAAIGIPRFINYIKRSRTSEADITMNTMTKGAVGYFTSDQKNCNGQLDCREPWHDTGQMKGMPVPWTAYVFPGGTSVSLDTKNGGQPPQGGKAYEPVINASKYQKQLLNHLKLSVNDPLRFKYTYQATGAGTSASATVRAIANFDTANSENHTVEQNIEIAQDGSPKINPRITLHEFK